MLVKFDESGYGGLAPSKFDLGLGTTMTCAEQGETIKCSVTGVFTPDEKITDQALNSKLTATLCSVIDGPTRGPIECVSVSTGIDYHTMLSEQLVAKGEAALDVSEYKITTKEDGTKELTDANGDPVTADAELIMKALKEGADGKMLLDARGVLEKDRVALTKLNGFTDSSL